MEQSELGIGRTQDVPSDTCLEDTEYVLSRYIQSLEESLFIERRRVDQLLSMLQSPRVETEPAQEIDWENMVPLRRASPTLSQLKSRAAAILSEKQKKTDDK